MKRTMNMKTNKKITPRSAALDSLMAVERDSRYTNLEINASLEKSGLSDADRGLYTRLVYGVTERRITLDYIISQYSSKPAAELDADVLTALRLGFYQLIYMDRIPDHAAVGETAGLVSGSKTGYVNAVLRSFLRASKKYKMPDGSDVTEYLSVKHSVPETLVKLFGECVPEAELDDLLGAMNREPHVGLRVNTLKLTPEEAAEKTGGRISDMAPDVVLTESFDEAARCGVEEGLWFVQDTASRVTSMALGAKSGETVVDTCACPGGKSFSVAMDMKNEGVLYSFDLHNNKLSLIAKGAEKLGISIITTEARDARKPKEELIGKADRVLCDAPCSGLGVLAKKPDIRYKDLGDIERLPDIQLAVLEGAAEYVKDGGVLVYSTCTLNIHENEEIVEKFLQRHSEFVLEKDALLGGGMKTFYPHIDGCDGFFAAKMKKNGNNIKD